MYSCKANDDMRMSCKFKNVTLLTFCYSVVLPLFNFNVRVLFNHEMLSSKLYN